jgi:putative SOS response-associated peptidase YedK
MCGRTTSYTPPQRLAEIFDADVAPDLDGPRHGPFWNVAPTNELFGLAAGKPDQGHARPVLGAYRWGLIPSWSQARTQGNRLFNARAETLTSKAAFRHAFRNRRLVVVVDGFYEWRKEAGGKRQPFYFHRWDGFPLAFAGLWEVWRDPETEGWLRSCSIVTTGAGPDLQGIHDRMPVVLEQEQLRGWLQSDDGRESDLTAYLRPAAAGTLACHPVGVRVGDVRNDSPDLLAPVEGAGGPHQPTLFG